MNLAQFGIMMSQVRQQPEQIYGPDTPLLKKKKKGTKQNPQKKPKKITLPLPMAKKTKISTCTLIYIFMSTE